MVPSTLGNRFKNSRSRLDRAYVHYQAFISEWHSILNDESATSIIRKDKDTGWHVISVQVDSEAIKRIESNHLSLVLGELAYQLRAALDGLIWDAITYTQGSEPPADANRLEFPILNGKIRDFKSCAFRSFPFPQNLSDWMETIQPGAAEKPIGDPDRGLQYILEDIHNLARFDRHRRLRFVGAVPFNTKINIVSLPPGGSVVAHEWLDCDIFNGKYDIVRIRVVCPGGLMPYHLRLKANITFEVSAEDIPIIPGENIGIQIGSFIQAVEYVMSRFNAEFS